MDLRRTTSLVLKMVLAALLIYWVIAQGGLDFNSLAKILNIKAVILLLALVGAQIFLNTYRWFSLLRGQGFTASLRRCWDLTLVGLFFNFAMPGGVGGDVIKGVYLVRDLSEKKWVAGLSIVLDRVVGMFSMMLMAFAALLLNWSLVTEQKDLMSMAIGVAGIVFIFAFAFIFALSKRVRHNLKFDLLFERLPFGEQLKVLYEAIHSFRDNRMALVQALLLSFVSQILSVLFFYFLALQLNVELPLMVLFFAVPVGLLATAVPISPAGIGVGQAAFYYLFNIVLGTNTQIGPTGITAYQAALFIWGLLGGVLYLTQFRRHKDVEYAR